MTLSKNPLIRTVQRLRNERRARQLNLEREGELNRDMNTLHNASYCEAEVEILDKAIAKMMKKGNRKRNVVWKPARHSQSEVYTEAAAGPSERIVVRKKERAK